MDEAHCRRRILQCTNNGDILQKASRCDSVSLCCCNTGCVLLTPCSLQYLFHLNVSDVHVDLDTITQQITDAGAVVSSYIPDNTFLVIAQPEKLEALEQVAGVSASSS